MANSTLTPTTVQSDSKSATALKIGVVLSAIVALAIAAESKRTSTHAPAAQPQEPPPPPPPRRGVMLKSADVYATPSDAGVKPIAKLAEGASVILPASQPQDGPGGGKIHTWQMIILEDGSGRVGWVWRELVLVSPPDASVAPPSAPSPPWAPPAQPTAPTVPAAQPTTPAAPTAPAAVPGPPPAPPAAQGGAAGGVAASALGALGGAVGGLGGVGKIAQGALTSSAAQGIANKAVSSISSLFSGSGGASSPASPGTSAGDGSSSSMPDLDFGSMVSGHRKPSAKIADAMAEILEHHLYKNGTIWVDGGVYIGRAYDGKEVQLGNVGREDMMLDYLNAHPSPIDW